MDTDNFAKKLEAMSDYAFMHIYRYKLGDYDAETIDIINIEYEKRKNINPNLELYYPVQYEERHTNNYTLADPGKRLSAVIIDNILILIFIIPFSLLMENIKGDFKDNLSVVAFLLSIFGFVSFQTWLLSEKGQTIGKIIMKIRIIKMSTGENGGFAINVLLRYVLNLLLGFVPVYSLIDALTIFGKDNRCIHDQIAGTIVVNSNKEVSSSGLADIYNSDNQSCTYRKEHYWGKRIAGIILSIVMGAGAATAIFYIVGMTTDTDNVEMAMKNYENGKYIEAIGNCDKALQKDTGDVAAYLYKGKSLNELGKFEEAVKAMQEAERLKIADPEIFTELGFSNYYLGKYNEALRCFTAALNIDQKFVDAYLWKAYTYMELGENDAAINIIDELAGFDPKNAQAYNAKGNAYICKEEYSKAVKAFDEAISIKPDYTSAYINKIKALYFQKKYTECLSFSGNTLELFPDNIDALWYKGDCYSAIQQHDEAISCYEEALKLDSNYDGIAVAIGWEYYYKQDYENASVYVEKALKINTENISAIELNKMLEEAMKPESERIANFIRNNYLYFDKVDGIDNILNDFAAKKQVGKNDIAQLIDSIRYKKDVFTFLLSDEYYDEYINTGTTNYIDSRIINSNTLYVRINLFTSGIANEFRNILEIVKDTENYSLIIDLRDNPGGLADPTNNILDILLPQCITSYMIYRDGQIYTYDSKGDQISFKHIYIFVNQNSASSSELLSLGLKKYLNNVTIIGSPTVGKGVGQITFENKQKKYVLFLVNHYWNVKEKNIMGENIIPDIPINSNEINDYLSASGVAVK